MEIDTTLSASISAAGLKAAYDASCKRLLSEKTILAWIMRECLPEFHGCDVREIAGRYIEGTPQVSAVPLVPNGARSTVTGRETDREDADREDAGSVIQGIGREDTVYGEGSVFFDILFHAAVPDSGDLVQLIINVEAQNQFYPGYPLLKRGMFYGGRLLSAQDGTVFTKAHYEKLRKVYSIWICTNPPKARENTITCYGMAERNLVGTVREDVRNYDLLSIVMICLGKPDDAEGILRLLGTLLSEETPPVEKKQVLRDEYKISMTMKLEKEVSLMCNLSDGVWEKAMAKGMAQGMAQGMARGMAQGMEQGRVLERKSTQLSNLRNLMRNTGWTAEKCMDVLNVPLDSRQDYASELSRQ